MRFWEHFRRDCLCRDWLYLGQNRTLFWAFAVAAAFCVLGVFSWIFLVCPVEPVVWTRQSSVDLGKADVELV